MHTAQILSRGACAPIVMRSGNHSEYCKCRECSGNAQPVGMTLEQWRGFCREVNGRAERIQRMIADRAKAAFTAAFGVDDAYSCFHYAGNWEGQSWLTPEQQRVCRLVRYLGEKRWEPGRIAERVTARAFEANRANWW